MGTIYLSNELHSREFSSSIIQSWIIDISYYKFLHLYCEQLHHRITNSIIISVQQHSANKQLSLVSSAAVVHGVTAVLLKFFSFVKVQLVVTESQTEEKIYELQQPIYLFFSL